MKAFVCTLVLLSGLSICTAQVKEDVEESLKHNFGVGAGWVYMNGDGSLNGINVSAEMIVVRPVSVAFDWDDTWNNSNLGAFQFTQTGAVATHSHLQNFIVGPRVYFPGAFKNKGKLHIISPYLEAQFGESKLSQKVTAASLGTVSASDTAFTWELGGGGDISLNPHWSFRPKIDLVRTHFSSSGQSHLRVSLGVMYTLRARRKS